MYQTQLERILVERVRSQLAVGLQFKPCLALQLHDAEDHWFGSWNK